MKELYKKLSASKAERFKFLADSVRFLESQGCHIGDEVLESACLASEEMVLGQAKIGLEKIDGRVAGILLL